MQIINATSHVVTIDGFEIRPSGYLARALEESKQVGILSGEGFPSLPLTRTQYTALVMDISSPIGSPSDRMVVGFPEPTDGVYYVVSSLAAEAAKRTGRETWDLLTPGQQVRDSEGKIVGCRSLQIVE
jgi:hypothetical protein